MFRFRKKFEVSKGEFSNDLDVRQVAAQDWMLLADLNYTSSWGWAITVPKGFVTDFFSTPRPLWWLLPKSGEYDAPAVIHDWLYRNHYTRWLGDGIIYESMKAIGCAVWKSWAAYIFLRAFGWIAWMREPNLLPPPIK